MAGIVTSEEASASNPLDLPARTICHVCQKQFSQYTCPRCNSRYCSLECYKSHSIRCTESFMKENVVEELRQARPDDATKRKMLDILKRLHAEEEEDGMDEGDFGMSEETVQKILSGGPISLNDLSAEERKRFQRAMASGELSKMIEPWDPWWTKPSARMIRLGPGGKRLVQPLASEEASGSSKSKEDSEEEFPPGPDSPLPSLSKLTTTEPSPFLAIHLVDIIYSYCFTLRLYNGDWQSDALGSAMVVLSISSVLANGGQPESMAEAISNCLEQACSPAYRHVGGLKFGMALVDDVAALLSLGTPGLICALSDLRRLLDAGLTELKKEKSPRVEVKNKFKSATRKVYFVMCWANGQPAEVWSTTAAILSAEKGALIHRGGGVENANRGDKVEEGRKVLIEEVQ
ncbi:hypothetical protein MLD38_039225 [Melastoma candidum]|uniref:Uncharacterized protein n=1 Tax=Melastoma candidum TaxID=119954 RepID=A0ACB9L1U7_9MYRT|nr:hypothetical protein MLD38_039225 [Melastoma candidum]